MKTTRKLVGEGGGKVILFGEHAVVYGHPAIAAGLGRGAMASALPGERHELTVIDGTSGRVIERVGPDDAVSLARAFSEMLRVMEISTPVALRVTVDLPMGGGLGSSAAIATAVCRALAAYVGDESRIDDAVRASETVFHDNPSGIDQFASMNAGLFEFRRTPEGPRTRVLRHEPARILICRAARGVSTSEMVAHVRDLHTRQPQMSFAIDDAIGTLGLLAAEAIERADWQAAGELMNVNHGLLCALGVSTLELDHACHVARRAGALGAKLTGAGGGGCVVALAPEREDDVVAAWTQRGWKAYTFDL